MRLRQIGAAAIVCALALAIGTAAEARGRHKPVRHDSAVARPCELTDYGRQICPGGEGRTTGRASVVARHSVRFASGAATVSRACLTPDTRAILEQAEAHFGVTFKLVSTCRPGAVIAGTEHPSEHRYGKAVDLLPPPGKKAAVVKWLFAHAPGVTMVYAHMPHVHFDTGPYHKLACGGCGRAPRRAHVAHLQ